MEPHNDGRKHKDHLVAIEWAIPPSGTFWQEGLREDHPPKGLPGHLVHGFGRVAGKATDWIPTRGPSTTAQSTGVARRPCPCTEAIVASELAKPIPGCVFTSSTTQCSGFFFRIRTPSTNRANVITDEASPLARRSSRIVI